MAGSTFVANTGQTVTVVQTAGNTIVQPQPDSVVWRFDANEYPGTGTVYTDPRGRTWTLSTAGTITPSVAAVTAVPAVKAQIIGYSYAHWNLQDIVPPATKVEALAASNDDGWRMRNLISKVRPIPGLPIGDTWQDPSTDPVGVPGPWPIAIALNTNPTLKLWDDHGNLLTPPTPNVVVAGITTPLYDTIFRLNMRDGVWYEEGVSGNIPLKWNADAQVWVTDYNPALWPDKGVKAKVP
jgi:hypothetical protein